MDRSIVEILSLVIFVRILSFFFKKSAYICAYALLFVSDVCIQYPIAPSLVRLRSLSVA
jgi:hypothetical protein